MAILLANTDEDFYNRWCGVSHHGNDDDHRRLSGSDDDGVNHPTLFGLRLRGHDVTLHFLVNDVLMAFFFGLAVKEICEAFQPGGSLYPPTRKAVNPIFGTLGGVIGPPPASLSAGPPIYITILFLFITSGTVKSYT